MSGPKSLLALVNIICIVLNLFSLFLSLVFRKDQINREKIREFIIRNYEKKEKNKSKYY